MPKTIIRYTLDELCNENKQIIIAPQEGVEIGIEKTPYGTRIYLYFGNEVERESNSSFLVKPK